MTIHRPDPFKHRPDEVSRIAVVGSVVFFAILGIWVLFFSGTDQTPAQDEGGAAVSTTTREIDSTSVASTVGVDSRLFTLEGLGASLRVPISWVETESRSGFDFLVEDPTDGGGFVLAARVLGVGGHEEFREARQDSLVGIGATIHSIDASTIEGHPTHVFHYEVDEPDAVVNLEYVIDAGDGTFIVVIVGEGQPAENSDLLEWIGSTITIGDLAIPVEVEPVALDEAGFLGSFVVPPGEKRQPAVLVLGGSEGGMPPGGVELARAGFPTLSLAYPPGARSPRSAG